MNNSHDKASGKRGRRRTDNAEAVSWRTLAEEFAVASTRYTGHKLFLCYQSYGFPSRGDFELVYAEEDTGEQGSILHSEEPIGLISPIAESTFYTLTTRGLLLAGRQITESRWRDWVEFIVDTLPWHTEAIKDRTGHGKTKDQVRLDYLKRLKLRFVDESVAACNQLQLKAISGVIIAPPPKLYAYGLAALREKHSLSQMGFAERLGYKNHAQVSRWETGRDPIPPVAVRRICDVFMCSEHTVLRSINDE